MHQLMEWVLDPAADVIWESVQTIVTQSGTREIRPRSEEQWFAVLSGAATLSESSQLLMQTGRAMDAQEWPKMVSRFKRAADRTLKAAQARDADEIFAAGGDLYEACKQCHQRYAPQLNSSTPVPSERVFSWATQPIEQVPQLKAVE
jgi:hypothetical protein